MSYQERSRLAMKHKKRLIGPEVFSSRWTNKGRRAVRDMLLEVTQEYCPLKPPTGDHSAQHALGKINS
jgi:hypothetical protein